MKRFLSLVLALATAFTTACLFTGNVSAAQKSADFVEVNKGGENGFVDKVATGTLEVVEIDGRKALKYTPDTTGENNGKTISFEGAGFAKLGADYSTYRYASVEYKYVSSKPQTSKFGVQFCNSNKVFSNGAKYVESQTIVAGDWTTAYFDLTSVIDGNLAADKDTHPVNHIHVRPFGNKVTAYMLDPGDVVYIGKVTFSEENLMPGGTTTQAPTASSAGTVIANGNTVTKDFSAINKGGTNGFMDKVPTGTLEVVEIDGRSALKYVPDTTGENSQKPIVFEGLGLATLGADYSTYRYASVEYKYVSAKPYCGDFKINLCNSNKVFGTGAGGLINSGVALTVGEWATAYFDLTKAVDGKLATDKETHPINHIHIRPFGSITPSTLDSGDVLYIGKISLSENNLAPGGVTKPLHASVTAEESENFASPTKTETPESLGTATTGATPIAVGADDIIVDYTTLNKGGITGLVDKKDMGTLEVVTVDGRSALKFTPNPKSPDASNVVALETTGISSKLPSPLNYEDFNFISVEYFYDTDDPAYSGKPAIYLANSNKVFARVSAPSADQSYVTNQWAVASFNITSAKEGLKEDMEVHPFQHIHFRPFGANAANNLKATDVIYIGRIGFHKENPMPKSKYDVSFRKGISGVELLETTGELEGKVMTYNKGESFTLPNCPWTVEGLKFNGWDVNGEVKAEGEVVLCEGDEDFAISALWIEDYEEVGFVDKSYPEIFSTVVDKKTNVIAESVGYGGLKCIKATPNPADENPGLMTLDSYGLTAKLSVDLDVYKYFTIIYRYDGEAHPEGALGRPYISVTRNNGMFNSTGMAFIHLEDHVTTDGWTASVYQLPDFTDKYTNPTAEHKLLQFHVQPFGNKLTSADFSAESHAYIQSVIFHEEKPVRAGYYTSYITGYTDGTFGVNKPMTRAQACTVVARLVAGNDDKVSATGCTFTDVTENAWYYKYVAFCQKKGLLDSYSGEFKPNANITRAEFAELVFNMGIVNAAGSAKVFADVSASHPRYDVITAASSAGLINGYSDGTFLPDREITRAQVVSVINNAYGRFTDAADLKSYEKMFSDVAPGHWAFSAIIDAAVMHTAVTEQGKEKASAWLMENASITEVDGEMLKEGEEKLAEIEALTEQRIAEIRATKTEVTVTGTKYYVSADGDDANDGKTPETAIKSLEGVGELGLKSGDGVFFRRGDTFRGSLYAVGGVTYSAYGEGAKPLLTASPADFAGADNWELTDTPNVYKLKTPIKNDVGLVVFNGGEAWSEKRIKGRSDFVEGKLSDLDCDLAMWHDVSTPTGVEGYVYVRSDKGNPGERFGSIEIAPRLHIIKGSSNMIVDNLCFKYTGAHGISLGNCRNILVQNCEFGWIGGSWFREDILSRYGNAVEVYGSCDGYVVDNCYIYQVYDAGVTHQLTQSPDMECIMKDIKYINNVITDTTYSVEYFIHEPSAGVNHYMQNFEISGNIMARSGFGFGNQRPDKNQAAHIKGWNSYNEAENYTITNNIFDRARYMMMQAGAQIQAWAPKTGGNTYIQYFNSDFGNIGSNFSIFDGGIEFTVKYAIGDETAEIYYLPEYAGQFD